MAAMTDAPGQSATQQIVKALATAYQRQGYHAVAVPASALLTVVDSRAELEPALAGLLDDGGVVPVGTNGVALHPSARAALLTRNVLERWLDRVSRESGPKYELYRDGIAGELAELVAWATNAAATLPPDLVQRCAELAGVLATAELDPRAVDIVSTHGGTPRTRLAALALVRPRSLPLDRLRDHLRHNVSSAYPAG